MRALAVIAAACAVLLGVGSAAFAQRQLLDLSGGAAAPAPGTGSGALALADELEFQAKAMDRTGDAHDRARASVRRLAARLLATGERAGLSGSARVVIGRTLASGMGAIDDTVGKIDGDGSAATLAMIAGDAASATRTLEAPGAEPWRLTRDGLALLTQQIGGAPAVAARQPLADRAGEWSALPGVRADLAKTLASLDAVLTPGEAWAAYRPSADHVRTLVGRAGEGLAGFPPWVPAPSRERLGEDFTRGVEGMLVREEQAGAEAKLARIARLADLVSKTDTLDTGTAGQKVRTTLAQMMGIPVADPSGERRALEAYERALTLATSKFALDDDRKLARPLRPAWRALAGMFKQAEPQLLSALPELIRRPEAMTEPGIVAIVNSQQRLADDLRALESMGETFGGPAPTPPGGKEPEVNAPWTKLAARVLKLGQDLSKPTMREPVLRALRTTLAQVRSYAAIPGEESLAEPAWDTLTGGRAKALREAIDTHRAAWLTGIEKGEPPEEESARLATIRTLLETLADLSTLEPANLPASTAAAYDRLQSVPSWELSGGALADLTSGLNEQVGEAARATIEDAPAKGTEALTKLRRERAALILAGRLSREAEKHVEGASPSADPLLQVGCGAPVRGAWLADHAADLATICRYAEEAPVARRTAARELAEADRKFANQAALRVLDQLRP